MAGMYTQDDFIRELQRSGLGNSFSDADMKLAMLNPDAGMSLISQKKAWGAATTDEERKAANAAAEDIRRQYGGYTGGVDGSGYTLEPTSPGSFSYGAAPTYQNQYKDTLNSLLNQQLTHGSFNDQTVKPIYNNRYDSQIQDALGQVTNPKEFSYSAESDPLYAQYSKTYAREGQRASEDAMGQAAAMTGGRPSSYAVTAAQQAGNYYAAQMADKVPELYDRAYQQYLNEYQMKQAALQSLMSAEQSDYAKYVNDMSQYNADRNFAYEQYLNDYNRILQDMASVQAMEQNDYAKYLDQMSQYNTDRNFAYGNYLDNINFQTQRRQEAAQAAQNALEQERYKQEWAYQTQQDALNRELYDREWQYQLEQDALDRDAYNREWQYQLEQNALDRATDNARYDAERKMEMAILAAEMGDMQLIRELGITPSSGMLQNASQGTEETAKYINFVLGYWDEPGVREYITSMTGLTPERYAEYLMMTEDVEIKYRPSTVATAKPVNPTGTVKPLNPAAPSFITGQINR